MGQQKVFLVGLIAAIMLSCPSFHIIAKVRASRASGRIHGGERAEDNEFPPTARIRLRSRRHICGATVINREWLVTAAHCVVVAKKQVVAHVTSFTIILGNNEDVESGLKRGEQRVNVTRIVVHERFSYNRQFMLDDIALIQVFPEIRFGKYVQPVNLQECKTFEPGEAWVVGWGNTGGSQSISPYLKKLKVKTISKEECRKGLDEAGFGDIKILPDSNICVKHEPKTGACQGDSGSPLYVWKDNKRTLEMIGVASAIGNGSDCENGFTFYMKVSYYRGWIYRRIAGCGNYPPPIYPQEERIYD